MSGFQYVYAPGETIKADPEHIKQHIENLSKMSYKEMLDDVVRDPTDSNVSIVRIVADMRLATTTKWMLVGTWAAVVVAVVAVLIAVIHLH